MTGGRQIALALKRAFDILVGLTALTLLSPFIVLAALAIKLDTRGPVSYLQKRVGRDGKVFACVKFRTMVVGAENQGLGLEVAQDDDRITRVGQLLRNWTFDEVPQLINVLKGDMSIVGPRPLTQEPFLLLPEEAREEFYSTRPGLTGIGSVAFRHEEEFLARSSKSTTDCYREDIAPFKAALELWYSRHRSFAVDLKIILLTAVTIPFPANQLYRRWLRALPEQTRMTGEVRSGT